MDDDERILVPIDDSDPSEGAVEFVRDRFPSSDTEVTLLHVVPTGSPMTDTRVFQEAAKRDEMEERLEEYGERLEAAGFDVTVRTVEGTPDREIVDFALEEGHTLIVIGSHGRQGINRVVLGSVAEKVVRRAPMPVTVVR